MSVLEKTDLQLGYIALLDCTALLWAQHRGYFGEAGLNVTLVREASWASLRDRLAFGLLDAAHCLSAMLPAARIGSDHVGIALQSGLVLSQTCASISLNQALCHQLQISKTDTPQISAQKVVDAIKDGHAIRLAHVFSHSIHHYCVREWLALADTELAKTIHLTTLPPAYVVDATRQRTVDGFCVSEPWNIQGELFGVSHAIAHSQDIISSVADKVLATTHEWASENPNTLNALHQAITQAQNELKTLEDFSEVWQLLIEHDIIQFQCSEYIHVESFYRIQQIIRDFVGESHAPKVEDFEWLIAQMLKYDTDTLQDIDPVKIAKACIGQIDQD